MEVVRFDLYVCLVRSRFCICGIWLYIISFAGNLLSSNTHHTTHSNGLECENTQKTELGNCCANSTTVTRPQHTNWSTTGNERKSNGEKKENENETRLDLCVAPEMVRITTHGARKMGKLKWEKNLFSHNRIPVAVDSYIFVRKNPMENLLLVELIFFQQNGKMWTTPIRCQVWRTSESATNFFSLSRNNWREKTRARVDEEKLLFFVM